LRTTSALNSRRKAINIDREQSITGGGLQAQSLKHKKTLEIDKRNALKIEINENSD
jgi:hypothetical protein